MSFRVRSPAAAAELQNHALKIDFAILKAAWHKSPMGLLCQAAAWPGEDHAAEGAVSRWASRLSPAGRAGMREGSAGSWLDRRRC